MSYTKTQWNNDTAPAINETNLNKIEQGIYDNDSHIGDLSDLETTANTDLVSAINENVSSIGDLSDLETTTQTDIVSAINENVDNIGDLTALTTTANTDLVSAINELDSDKLDATATATNSVKWDNLERNTVTNNDTDTWIPVLNGEKMQHTTVQSIVNRGSVFTGRTGMAKNSTYVGNEGYRWCYTNNNLCCLNLNFQIPTTLQTKDLTLYTNLPIPKSRVTTGCFVGTGTPERLYIDTDGTLKTDSVPFEAGWVNFCIMYPLA